MKENDGRRLDHATSEFLRVMAVPRVVEDGEAPVAKTGGQQQKVNAVSAVNAKGAFWCDVYTGNLNSERFIGFPRAFMRGCGKVFLVLDGCPIHWDKRVRDFVKELKGRLELHFLPPYAPDLNPDEFVWQYAKRNSVAKIPLRRNESLCERVESNPTGIARNKRLIKSFLHAKSMSCAMN